jgi:hypothetical protein
VQGRYLPLALGIKHDAKTREVTPSGDRPSSNLLRVLESSRLKSHHTSWVAEDALRAGKGIGHPFSARVLTICGEGCRARRVDR